MNPILYNQVLNAVNSLPSGANFELNQDFYLNANLVSTKGERLSIGKKFYKNVCNGTITFVRNRIIRQSCGHCNTTKTNNHKQYTRI